jgi:dihydrofolate synthase/folylpolyglutamate synthase
VDIAVIEVGLGGKYDATNVIENAVLSVLTTIDFDHTELLGNSIRSIAVEKAGIIKKSVSVVSAIQKPSVEKIIKDEAKESNSKIYFFSKDFWYENSSISPAHTRRGGEMMQKFSYFDPDGSYKNLKLYLLGKHQLINSSIALKSINLLNQNGFDIPEEAIYKGLKKVNWECRFEFKTMNRNGSKVDVIIDGAHNPSGIKALVSTLKDFWEERVIMGCGVNLVMSVMKEKDYEKMIRELANITETVILYKCSNSRSAAPETLSEVWKKYLPEKCISIANSIEDTISKLKQDRINCITGSLYFAGEFKKFMQSF